MTATTTGVHERAGIREWSGLAVLALAALVVAIDTSVVLLALPSIAADLDVDASEQLWIVDAYGFALAGFLVAFGSLADRLGRRRMAVIGAATIGVASAVAAFAPSPEVLIAARAITGIGAAALTPSLYGLLTGLFRDDRQRSAALGVFMTCLMGGMIIGPLVGGVMLSSFRWGSVFLLAVPVMALVLAMFPFLVPERRHQTGANVGAAVDAGQPRRGVDWVSVPLSLASILPVVYGLKEFARAGIQWSPALAILLGVMFAAVFIRRQQQLDGDARRAPLLDLTMFRTRGFGLVLFSLFAMTMLTGPMMMLNTQFFQLVSGVDVLAAGILTVPPAIVSIAGFIVMPLIARRIRPGIVISAGLALTVVGLVVMTQVSPASGPWPLVLGFSIVSFGATPLPTLGTNLIIGSVPLEQASSAASTSETSGQLGYALGIAVIGSIVTAVYRLGFPPIPGLSPADRAIASESIARAVELATSSGDDALRAAAATAYSSGIQTAALIAAAIMAVLAVITAVKLRHIEPFGR
ncbi:DHA2 family multidrug resistance protein-like MFS transporter [Agromyces cerinus]|uniref:MFS transporter n=1 Tax=Agromyces cerinus TaxID=33878 RepID=UPI00195ADB22|nr:MFS transporter [Agromyces cerinus]MBM7832731.1 DHA2 family multidrug resistance protein-like MFS transporter [Agromyces cerinus]